jgi:hypothetical protein
MRRTGAQRPGRVDRSTPLRQAQGPVMRRGVLQGMALYREFNRFGPSRVLKLAQCRIIPPVVVELGELVGLIYRSDKGQRGRLRTYIHFLEDPPRLVSNPEGSQLYIVGGSYRVTRRGIEG